MGNLIENDFESGSDQEDRVVECPKLREMVPQHSLDMVQKTACQNVKS